MSTYFTVLSDCSRAGTQLLIGSNGVEFTSQQQHITALGLQASGDYSGAARELAGALHLCPWNTEVRFKSFV